MNPKTISKVSDKKGNILHEAGIHSNGRSYQTRTKIEDVQYCKSKRRVSDSILTQIISFQSKVNVLKKKVEIVRSILKNSDLFRR